MFQESFFMLKALKIYIWDYFLKLFQVSFFQSNVHRSLFLKLKNILILIIKITTWVEIGEIYVYNTFWRFWFKYAFGHENYEFQRCVSNKKYSFLIDKKHECIVHMI